MAFDPFIHIPATVSSLQFRVTAGSVEGTFEALRHGRH